MHIKTGDNPKIFPNPTTNMIVVTVGAGTLSEITIYNTLAQNVTNLTQQITINEGRIVIDLSGLSSGIYYIKTKNTATKVYKQ